MDTCRAWLINAIIIVAVSLLFTYRPAGQEQSTLWVAGGPGFSQSVGSGYRSGMMAVSALPGYKTNGLAFVLLPVGFVFALLAGPQTSNWRQRLLGAAVVFCITASVLLTKAESLGGMGFKLGLLGIGLSLYAIKHAGKSPPASAPSP